MRRARLKPQATRAELIRLLRTLDRRLTEIGSRWFDSLPPRARYELLQLRNPVQRVLLREPGNNKH